MFQTLKTAFQKEPMFEGKQWKYSPSPLPLSPSQLKELHQIGTACSEFYKAIDRLYFLTKNKKKILRNKDLFANWLPHYWEHGKPQSLINHMSAPNQKGSTPPLIRPDLLLTQNGFALTELDSVPGGFPLTIYLMQLYGLNTSNILPSFYNALTPTKKTIAILVSQEASTYKPELQWLATQLQNNNFPVYCLSPEELNGTYYHNIKIDIIYRFFELFDLPNIPNIQSLISASENQEISITPPLKTYHEEKLNLALFHHFHLKPYWQESLSPPSLCLLNKIIPKTWIIDPQPIPPNASLNAPEIDGQKFTNWLELSTLTQKQRSQFVIKISGFDERCWGSRSVTIGEDSSQKEWQSAIHTAINEAHAGKYYVIQEYCKPILIKHKVFTETGEIISKTGRARLCPYYISTPKKTELTAVLTTICPPDKKIIHGMNDCIMLSSKIN